MTTTRSPLPSEKGPGERRRLVVLLGVLAVVVVAGLGYVLLGTGDPAPVETILPSARTSGAGSGAASSGSASASASGSVSGSATATGAAGSARNPFGAAAGAGAGGSTGSTVTTTAPTGATSTSSSTSATAPTGSTAPPTATATTVTTTTRVTATLTRTAAPTTTTVTVTAQPLYVGLYGWTNGGRPIFRVNDAGVAPAVGDTFGTSLVYDGTYLSDGETCATISYVSSSYGLCPGEVVKLA